jgi:putative membrane protein
MKTLKFVVIILSVAMMACNNRPKTDSSKDTDKNAMLVENAKVEGQDNEQGDQGFLNEAASGGMMEVELGRYAQENAVNPRVKNFGAMMVRDHSKANEELKSLASSKSLTLPSSMDEKHMNKVNELKGKTGADFDKEYMKEMVDDHEKDVDEFRKQSENAKDADIKAFAAKTLPILQTHQDSAKAIRDALDKNNK